MSRYAAKARSNESVSQWLNGSDKPWYQFGVNEPHTSASVSVTAGTPAHTEGAWTELVASTADQSSMLMITVGQASVSGSARTHLLDIGVGASGSEVAIAENINVGQATGLIDNVLWNGIVFPLPVYVPAGSRISVRMQSAIASSTATVWVRCHKIGESSTCPTSLDVLGAVTANSTGTILTGASGTYVQVAASTTKTYGALILVGAGATAALATECRPLTVAVGASGSEIDVGSMLLQSSGNEELMNPLNYGLPIFPGLVPVGSRISVKHVYPSTPTRYCVVVIGVPV